MKDFDPHFKDLPDYILGITREIWEDRGVGPKLKRYYADDVLVRAPSGILTDNNGVTAATLQTLHEFPDRQLVGEDVIWHGDEEQDDGRDALHEAQPAEPDEVGGVEGRRRGRVVVVRHGVLRWDVKSAHATHRSQWGNGAQAAAIGRTLIVRSGATTTR